MRGTERPPRRPLSAGGLLVLLLAACHLPSGGGDLPAGGGLNEPHRAFTHEQHGSALDAPGFDCERCHVTVEEELTEEVSPQGRQSCHVCHREGAERAKGAKAASRCGTCHTDLRSVVPASHGAGWVNDHGTRMNGGEAACSPCHSNRFCVRCHSRRDPAERVFHRGNVLMTHPVEARADPGQCQRCHRADLCVRCHSRKAF